MWPVAQDGTGHDDAAARAHPARGRAGAEERPGQVGVDNLPPSVGRHLRDVRVLARDPGVGDPDVHATEPLGHPLGHGLVEKLLAHVARADQVLPGQAGRYTLQGGLGARDQPEVRARGVEGRGEHPAKAAPGTGDDHATPADVGVLRGTGPAVGDQLFLVHGR